MSERTVECPPHLRFQERQLFASTRDARVVAVLERLSREREARRRMGDAILWYASELNGARAKRVLRETA